MGVWVDTHSVDGVAVAWQGLFIFRNSRLTKMVFGVLGKTNGLKLYPEFEILVKMASWTL